MRSRTNPTTTTAATAHPSSRIDGAYIGPGGPTYDQLVDQSADNPWRTPLDAVEPLVDLVTDPEQMNDLRRQHRDQENYVGVQSIYAWTRQQAQLQAGMPIKEPRWGDDNLEWPDGVSEPARGWVYWCFDMARQRAEATASDRAKGAAWAAQNLEASRCRYCGKTGGHRLPNPEADTLEVPGWYAFATAHDHCARHRRWELLTLAGTTITASGETTAQAIANHRNSQA